jgi:protein TonB
MPPIRMSWALVVVLVAALPAAPVTASASPQQRLRVGGAVKAPKKIKDVAPVYPEDARAAKAEGVVVIETVIATDGTVHEATVLRGVPQLDKAALDAVVQWRYTPTLLNGEPVELVMTVTITFALKKNDAP